MSLMQFSGLLVVWLLSTLFIATLTWFEFRRVRFNFILIPLAEMRRAIHEYEHPHLRIDIDALIRRLVGSILLPIDSEFTPFILTVHRGVDHERCI